VAERLSLHDVVDVEKFCFTIAERSGIDNWSDKEDLAAYLVETCWRLSLSFEPGGITFSTFAGTTLRRRVVDFQRKQHGRTRWTRSDGYVYERPRPKFVSLDGAERDQLEHALPEIPGDRETDRDATFRGLLADRDRHRVRDLYEMGLEPDRRAA
jgi:DNA-directed RNA polymerase specialized sigma24 family protein